MDLIAAMLILMIDAYDFLENDPPCLYNGMDLKYLIKKISDDRIVSNIPNRIDMTTYCKDKDCFISDDIVQIWSAYMDWDTYSRDIHKNFRDILLQYKDWINWDTVSKTHITLDIDVYLAVKDELDWMMVSKNHIITYDIYDRFKDYLSIPDVYRNPRTPKTILKSIIASKDHKNIRISYRLESFDSLYEMIDAITCKRKLLGLLAEIANGCNAYGIKEIANKLRPRSDLLYQALRILNKYNPSYLEEIRTILDYDDACFDVDGYHAVLDH